MEQQKRLARIPPWKKFWFLKVMLDRMVCHSVHQSPERHPGLMDLILCILVNQQTVRYSAAKETKFSDDF